MRASLLGPVAIALVTACGGDSFSGAPAGVNGGASGSGGGGSAGSASGGTGGGGGSASGGGGATAGGGGTTGSGGASGAPGAGGAGVGTDAGPAHWCDDKHALFCADFDEFTTVDALLNSFTTYSTVGADFSLDSGAGVPSSPNALRIRTTSDKDVRGIVVQKIAPFSTPPDHVRLEFSLRVDAGGSVAFLSGAAIVALFMGDDVTDGAIALEVGNGPTLSAAYLEPQAVGGFGTSNVPGLFPKPNQWSGRYALDVTYGASPDVDGGRTGCLELLLGGVPQLTPCLKLAKSLVDPAFVSVALGVYSGGLGQTGDVQIRLDDVILTAD
ncbi:MAG TPA: hypothetical protein VHE30_25295 [Polyangiaceae bacterium]|nr:hypothetical protein [Polyangiaceae bacterium]